MKNVLTILLISINLEGFGQIELVQNGDFEVYSVLPDFLNQLDRADGWFNPMFEGCVWSTDSCSTPDYFHLQGTGLAQLPNNFFASVQPYEGSGIGGVAAIVNWGGREFGYTQFNGSMIIGGRYQLSLFITNGVPNLGGDSGTGWGLDGFGVGLSTNEPVQYHYAMPPPAVATTFTIDTVFFSEDWVEYSVVVIADSAYQYLTIGNFKEGENEMVQYYPEQSMFDVAYYFIDDVSVIRLDTANSVYEWQEATHTFSQTAEQITIGLDEHARGATATLYDMSGRETGKANGQGRLLNLPLGNLPKGIYALQLQTAAGTVSRKVVIP